MKAISKIKMELGKKFNMKDLVHVRRILDIEINRVRSNSYLYVHQTPYVLNVLKKFSMLDCKPVSVLFGNHFILPKEQSPANNEEKYLMSNFPYSNIIGSIMYLMICTRPDLDFTVNVLSKYLSNSGSKH